MDERELISVIVPVYNVAEYLERCVRSLLNQSYADIEVLLIDDGSNDGTAEIADGFAREDKRVRVLHQTYHGVADARNKGLLLSKGKYIIFLDGDDEAHRDYVGKLYHVLKENELDIAQCCLVRCRNGVPYNMREVTDRVRIYSGLEMQPKTFIKDRYFYTVVCGKLYKKELFDGLEFPVGRINEDSALIYRLYYNAKRIGVIDDYLYFYHYNGSSITEKKTTVARLDCYYYLKEKYDFYRANGLNQLADMTADEYFSCMSVNFVTPKSTIENPEAYFSKLKEFYQKDRTTMLRPSKMRVYKKIFVYASYISVDMIKVYGWGINYIKNIKKRVQK